MEVWENLCKACREGEVQQGRLEAFGKYPDVLGQVTFSFLTNLDASTSGHAEKLSRDRFSLLTFIPLPKQVLEVLGRELVDVLRLGAQDLSGQALGKRQTVSAKCHLLSPLLL